ncbi:polysaccharide biosynthesis C-terminal domain-containing protein [Vibrio splendidus]
MNILENISYIKNNEFICRVIDGFFGYASMSIMTILFTYVCTQIFDVDTFGEYSYLLTIIMMSSVFVKMGMDNSIIYFSPKVGVRYNTTTLIISSLVSLVVGLFFYVSSNEYFYYISLASLFLALKEIFFSIYRTEMLIRQYYRVIFFFLGIGQFLFLGIFYFTQESSVFLLLNSLLASYLFLLLFLFFENRDSFKKPHIDIGFLRYSIPTIFISAIAMVMNKIDIVMIGNMLSNSDVAIYQVSNQVANFIGLFIGVFNISFAPKIARLYSENRIEELVSIYIKSTRILSLLCLFPVALLILFSNEILGAFGDRYLEADFSFIIRVIGQYAIIIVGSVGFMLTMIGKVKGQLYRVAFSAFVNVILNYLLIPIYGINGAAVATLISITISSLLGYIFVKKEFNLTLFRFF